MKGKRNEKSYYAEIKRGIGELLTCNFQVNYQREIYIYWGIGELKSNLEQIIKSHPSTCSCAASFVRSVPPLNLDIFALVTDGSHYELLILEVKIGKPAGLKEWSQLVGYCLVSGAKYGLLVNIDEEASPRLADILVSSPHLSHIEVRVQKESRLHLLGFMSWDSTTCDFEYRNLGYITSLSQLTRCLAGDFP